MKDRKPINKDWAAKVEALRLLNWSDLLDGIPPGSKQPGADTPMRPIQPEERRAIAEYLRRLASNPRALGALLDAAQRPRRRGPKANRPRAWRAALEFELRRGEGKFDLVTSDVARAWGVSRAGLAEAWVKQHARTPGNRQLGGWRYWASYELKRFRAAHRGMKPRAFRVAFIKHLRSLQ
jgi:hypothetical protein